MKSPIPLIVLCAAIQTSSAPLAQEQLLDLVGSWKLTSYVKADTKVRYKTTGYMLFTKTHWMHAAYFNRDAQPDDFAEAHHGTWRFTGPGRLVLDVDMELHMDPKKEFQQTPVWYGPPATVNSTYRRQGSEVVLDFASGAQCVLERIE